MTDKLKVLFVCTANRMRSRTAETLYENDRRFEVRSAGTSMLAERVVDEDILSWADWIVVMEEAHRRRIQRNFRKTVKNKVIISLDIPDIYYYMDPTLMRDIKARFEEAYTRNRR